jgi:hypothetical protein
MSEEFDQFLDDLEKAEREAEAEEHNRLTSTLIAFCTAKINLGTPEVVVVSALADALAAAVVAFMEHNNKEELQNLLDSIRDRVVEGWEIVKALRPGDPRGA